MATPVLTLITPTYNRRPYLMQTLECYCSQAIPEVELIVVDDGSTDGTLDQVRARFPEVRTLRSPRREGPSVARNRALRLARGQYVLPLDSDCFLPDGTLDFLVGELSRRPEGVYVFPCRSWPERKLSTPQRCEMSVALEQLLMKQLGEVIPALPLRVLREQGLSYPEHFAGGEPFLLFQLRTLMEVTFIPRVVLEYRTDIPMRISSPEYQVRHPLAIAEVLEATLPFYYRCNSLESQRHKAHTMEKIGIYKLLAGHRVGALGFLWKSFRAGRLSAPGFVFCSLLPTALLRRLFLLARKLKPRNV